MKERPILMSTENVKAILEDRKTQTRRVIKPQPIIADTYKGLTIKDLEFDGFKCPYGQVGDRLWVRETWAVNKTWDCFKPSAIPSGESVYYPEGGDPNDETTKPYWVGEKRNKLFMPRWASRINLEITEIRAERLQEITEGDVKAEGLNSREDFRACWNKLNAKWKRVYNRELKIYEFWQSPWCAEDAKPIPKTTKYPERYHCIPNPWVWVLTFKVI